jgi:site-specific DNA-adenine methylase
LPLLLGADVPVNDALKAPFIWFGGKRRVADVVWTALGDVDNYVEPFAGSLAVLLARPAWHRMACETVNDADLFLANFWRALAAEPQAVARWCDWPVNEADLFARHLWLVNDGRATLAAGIETDPDWYDAKIAGWWVWGLNAWIGSGWCSGDGPWTREVLAEARQLPHLGDAGQGVNRQLPHLGDAGQGVNRKLPHLGDAGQGVNRKRPHLGNTGQEAGEPGCESQATAPWEHGPLIPTNAALYDYFGDLARRLRGVRVCTGDWSRVLTNGATAYGATVGVFLDPPYLGTVRTGNLYATDDHDVSTAVREWAIAKGADPRYRIVLAGYEPEHAAAMAAAGWRMQVHKASAAYQTAAQEGGVAGNQGNRRLERLWFSPSCLDQQLGLLEAVS